MAVKIIDAKIRWRKDTAANWASVNPVLEDGEIAIVVTAAGDTRFKVGDGVKTFGALPFQDEFMLALLNERALATHSHEGLLTQEGLEKVASIPEDMVSYEAVGLTTEMPGTLDADLLGGKDKTYILSRNNHTGTQEMSTILGLETALTEKSSVNHGHTLEDLGAAAAGHTHTAAEVGARASSWVPTAAQVGALGLSGGTMTGALVAASGNLTTRQVRNVVISTGDPTGGSDGDIWIKYSV